jgi:hypothetical protein
VVAGDDQSEIGGAASYYIKKHRLKLQADYRVIEDDSRRLKEREFRSQLQFVF